MTPFSKISKTETNRLSQLEKNMKFDSVSDEIMMSIHAIACDANLRIKTVEILKVFLDQNRTLLETLLEEKPFLAPKVIELYSTLSDTIILAALNIAVKYIHPIANPTNSEKICLVAVGGYGRQELAPFSDIDLLFLTPYKQTAWGESVIETVLYILWDLKLKIGYSVRTINDCLRLSLQDFTIRTSLLDNRYLAGEKTLLTDLNTRLWGELFISSPSEFIEAKLIERTNRHNRQGRSRYMLEPNVKEGKGGLRDLQTLYWITKYLYRTPSQEKLIEAGVFTKEELLIFKKAENFLWSVRCGLHLLSKRAGEQLNFTSQVELSKRLGFVDKKGMRAVETFMQLYFLHAKNVGDLTRIFLTSLETKHVKKKPTIAFQLRYLMGTNFGLGKEVLPKEFSLIHGRLNIVDAEEFLQNPSNLLKLFQLSLKSKSLIHPEALRLVAGNLELIDENFKNSPQNNKNFLDLLLNYDSPEKALRHMNEVGILGAFIPEFGRIVAMMQFNMYHSYTVDEHTIQCIHNLSEIEHGKLHEDLPIASEILEGDINRKILYVALLLHDIGKGLPEDHSKIGAKIARRLAPRLGLKSEECETVQWLIENHLLMSDVAQKRDITDNRTVQNFAKQVTSAARLKLLTVLTVCDIRGVGPNSWNNWKAVLLRELYKQTLSTLNEGSMTHSRPEKVKDAKRKVESKLSHWNRLDLAKELKRHYESYWLGLDMETQIIFANLLHGIKGEILKLKIDTDIARDANSVCCVMEDHPGIFARLSGALALLGANVVDARTYTTRDGFATAVFWIQEQNGLPFEDSRLAKLEQVIKKSLYGEVITQKELDEKGKFKKTEREFKVPTTITFDNLGSDIYTIIEIDTRDRIGLIHDLTSTLYKNNISIFTAIVATYGEQAVDTFYVKDLFGLKIYNKTKQEKIIVKLRESIELGSEKAMQ